MNGGKTWNEFREALHENHKIKRLRYTPENTNLSFLSHIFPVYSTFVLKMTTLNFFIYFFFGPKYAITPGGNTHFQRYSQIVGWLWMRFFKFNATIE